MRDAPVTRRSDRLRSAKVSVIAVLAWIGVGSSSDPAIALDPGEDLERLTYQAWSVENGLPQETVHAMAQTPDGYLWLGTHGGLVRTDGLRFVVFDRQRSELLGAAWINDLLVDRDGVLWIAANDGLFSYADERFERWDDRFGLPGARVLRLALGRRGIWFSSYAGDLAHWDGEQVESFTVAEHGAPPGAA
ncbi:MAG: two-component regulator propeller domain-containing protein, partial [Acidobacteriota bacterium]